MRCCLKAKITGKVGASLERELPANIHKLHHALVEMGIRKAPRSFPLTGDNAADVELTAESEIGIGTLHCKFGNDRSLGLIPGEDSFRKLTEDKLAEEQETDMEDNMDEDGPSMRM